MMDDFKQDSTLQQLGITYQYLVACTMCLKIKDCYITIEKNGDVSIFSNDETYLEQYEVKHHLAETHLTNKSIDFWKTLNNWCSNIENSIKFSKLILHTTSSINKDSIFFNWNEKNADEKFNLLDNARKSHNLSDTDYAKDFKKFYDKIFSIDKDNLLIILNKLEISCDNDKIDDLYNELSSNNIMQLFTDQNRKIVKDQLLGYIQSLPINKMDEWKVTSSKVIDIVKKLLFSLENQVKVFDDNFPNEKIPTNEKNNYYNKTFVSELLRVKLDNEVDNAIHDYWKMSNIIMKGIKDDPTTKSEVFKYQDSLRIKIIDIKNEVSDEIGNPISEEQIFSLSKRFFRKSMVLDYRPQTFIINSESVRKGLVHCIVDDKKITWHIGEKNEY